MRTTRDTVGRAWTNRPACAHDITRTRARGQQELDGKHCEEVEQRRCERTSRCTREAPHLVHVEDALEELLLGGLVVLVGPHERDHVLHSADPGTRDAGGQLDLRV